MYLELLLLVFAIATEAVEFQQRIPCRPVQAPYGEVCLNDANYCDTLDVKILTKHNVYTLVTSSLSGDRFSFKYGEILPRHKIRDVGTRIDIDKQQKCGGSNFVGFGGGFSDSVSYILNRLPESIRNCVYKSYFSSDVGMELSMLRLPIGGTSFSSVPWTYSETPVNDTSLSQFTQLDPRDEQRNRQIKEIMKIAKRLDFKILAVPYSAPPWMKGNNNFAGGATSQLKPEFYQAWADYYVKYLRYMEKDGMSIWAVTSGDEPTVASIVSDFEFMGWKAPDQGTR